LSGAGVGIGIDESAHLRIVIAGLEVVEGGFSVLGLSARIVYTQAAPHETARVSCGDFSYLAISGHIEIDYTGFVIGVCCPYLGVGREADVQFVNKKVKLFTIFILFL
jgi:hypothetical protein